ncbi:MAG: hypothetical protein ACI3ZQ_05030 [Candidatus Cryptobacteroides sp.]
MKLITQKGEIELPNDFSFEIEVNNPFFSDDGTASVPAEIPGTRHNLALLGNPDRIAMSNRYMSTFPALLQHGAFQRKCNLIVDGFSSEGSLTASLAFAESDMYVSIQEKQLKDIFKDKYLPLKTEAITTDIITDNVRALSDIYHSVDAMNGDVTIFPVVVEKNEYDYSYLNEPTESELAFVYSKRTITSGENSVDVPNGYGVTAFLWLRVLIRQTFELCGYKVTYNVFEQIPFRHLVVLNNCADGLCKMKGMCYADMVPSITVGELILWLKDKFGAAVCVNHNEISIELIDHTINNMWKEDLSKYMRDSPTISYPLSSRVVLSCDTSLEGAAAPADTFQEFARNHPVIKHPPASGRWAKGLYFVPYSGQFHSVSTKEKLDGSNCFKYDRENSEETEEHSTDDRFVPEVFYNDMLVPYIGNRLHYNTSIVGVKEEESQPLQICWALFDDENNRWTGNTQPYVTTQNSISGIPVLTPDGLYDECWKSYNELLLNSAPVIEAQIDYPLSLLLSMDLMKAKFINGQKVIIKSFSYTISDTGVKCGRTKMLLLPEYQDKIIDEPIDINDKARFAWKIGNNQSEQFTGGNAYNFETEVLQIVAWDHEQEYTMKDAPKMLPEFEGQKDKIRLRWTDFEVLEAAGAVPTGRILHVVYNEWFEGYVVKE